MRDRALVVGPCRFNGRAALLRRQHLVPPEELLHLHGVIGECLGGRVDRSQPPADDDDRQAQLHVGERIRPRRAGQLQRHQEIGRGANAVGEPVRQLEHRRLPRARGDGHVVEAECKCALGVQRSAEAHASVQREPRAPLEQEPDQLQEILVPAHGDAVFGHAAKAGHAPCLERLCEHRDVADGRERHALAFERDSRQRGLERLDLEAVDADDGVPVVQQVMRERESGRTHAHDEHALPGRRQG